MILISGIGRSGTTALRQAFSAHPRVHSTGNENNIIYDVTEAARHNCTYWSRKGTMHVVQPAYDRQFKLLLLNLLWPNPRRGSKRPAALVAASDMGPDRADYFCRMFSNCRIAYIVRNGIEVVASRMSHENFKHVPFEEHCRIWTRGYMMAKWGDSRSEFVLIRHDELIASPEHTLSSALKACGLSFEPCCLQEVTGKTFHPTVHEGEDADVAEDLTKRHQRWTRWTDEERHTFTEICGEGMSYLGYPMEWLQ